MTRSCQTPCAAERAAARQARGATMVEIGFIIGIMGLLVLMFADQYTGRLLLLGHEHRIDGVVRDVTSLADASRAYAMRHFGTWPKNSTGRVDIDELEPYLDAVPETRFPDVCQGSCDDWDYRLVGWDRAAKAETRIANRADDLLIRFRIEGTERLARHIASRIPFGHYACVTSEGKCLDQYDLEARLLSGRRADGNNAFVRVLGENRVVRMDDGELWGMRRVTQTVQDRTLTQVDGTGLDLKAHEIHLGAFGTSSGAAASTLHLLDRSSPSAAAEVRFVLRDGRGRRHLLRFGLDSSTDQPYVEARAIVSADLTGGVPLRLVHRPAISGEGNSTPASWDLQMAERSADQCTQGIHDRICAFERDLAGRKTLFTTAPSADSACRALPTCP